MSSTPETAKDLLAFVELVGIEVYDLRATRVEREDPDSFTDGYEIRTAIAIEPETIRTRFTLESHSLQADYTVDLAARYSVDKDVEVSQAVVVEFIEAVGVMAAFPFLRENLFGLATRLGTPVPVLGLLQQGGFRLDAEGVAE